jgi:hypothetical protein
MIYLVLSQYETHAPEKKLLKELVPLIKKYVYGPVQFCVSVFSDYYLCFPITKKKSVNIIALFIKAFAKREREEIILRNEKFTGYKH